MIKLATCNYKKKKLGKSLSATKSDFEEFIGVCPRNNDLRSFLQELIEEGILQFFDLSDKKAKKFVINEKKIMKKIKSLDLGKKFYDLCVHDYTSF